MRVVYSLNDPSHITCENVCKSISRLIEQNKENIEDKVLVIEIKTVTKTDQSLLLRLTHKELK